MENGAEVVRGSFIFRAPFFHSSSGKGGRYTMSTRIDRISEEVRKALAEAIRSVKDPRVQIGLVSVVHCEVTNDLRYA